MDSSDSNEDLIPPGPFDHRTLDRLLTKAKDQSAEPLVRVQLDEARRPVIAQEPSVRPELKKVSAPARKSEPDGTWAERIEVWLAWTAMVAVVVAVGYVVYEALFTWGVIS